MAILLAVALPAVAIIALRSCGGSDGERSAPVSAAAALDDSELAGRRLIAGWDGVSPPQGLRKLIREGEVAGVILFEDNIPSRGQARRTIRSLQAIPRPEPLTDPLLVMVDQEGGQVRRLDGPPGSSAEEMGAEGKAFARAQGRATGVSLRDVGFNVDLAPVLDLARPGGAIDREQRSFGDTPEQVIDVGVEGFTAGLSEGGIVATAKHYPGIGDAETNTDEAAQSVDLTATEIEAGPERPFGAFVASGGRMVMSSLVTYPEVADRPAAFSRRVVTDRLRDELGFDGVVITDGLGAAAASAFGNDRRIALAAVEAGNDLLLYSDWERARDAGRLFARRLRAGALDRAGFERSAERVLDLSAFIGERALEPEPGAGSEAAPVVNRSDSVAIDGGVNQRSRRG